MEQTPEIRRKTTAINHPKEIRDVVKETKKFGKSRE